MSVAADRSQEPFVVSKSHSDAQHCVSGKCDAMSACCDQGNRMSVALACKERCGALQILPLHVLMSRCVLKPGPVTRISRKKYPREQSAQACLPGLSISRYVYGLLGALCLAFARLWVDQTKSTDSKVCVLLLSVCWLCKVRFALSRSVGPGGSACQAKHLASAYSDTYKAPKSLCKCSPK